MSSSGGRFSGIILFFAKTVLISLLFLTCSLVIFTSPCTSLFLTLKLVISVAKFLAAMVTVGRKSARARLGGNENSPLEPISGLRPDLYGSRIYWRVFGTEKSVIFRSERPSLS